MSVTNPTFLVWTKCASVNNNKKCAIGRSENERKFYRRDRASLNYSISILLVWRKMLTSFMYGPGQANLVVTTYASSEGSGDPAPRQNLSCSLKQAMSQEEPSDRKPDPWPLWMTGHEQLKFFMTRNARRHKFAWRGPKTKFERTFYDLFLADDINMPMNNSVWTRMRLRHFVLIAGKIIFFCINVVFL